MLQIDEKKILEGLREQSALPFLELSVITNIPSGNLRDAVDRMEWKGFVTVRNRCPGCVDTTVEATNEGKNILRKCTIQYSHSR